MITFFGASVTLQKTGYAKVLETMFDEDVKIYGYGGMHIKNAGICFIDEVLAVKPKYCFIDFFSTVYQEENDLTKEYIDTIIYKFSKINCKLVFLFFSKGLNTDSWYKFCKNYLDEKNLKYIDVDEKLKDIDKKKYLKDEVHTNEYGSKLYAEIIFDEFNKIKDDIQLPKNTYPTKFIDIKKLTIERTFDKYIILNGSAQIIGIDNTIGPYTGVIEIKTDENIPYKENMWDEWCYYTRKHFNLPFSFKNKAKITLLNDSFNTSSCKYNIDFSKKNKKIIIHDIYYIGEKFEIENLNEGKKISEFNLSLLNYKGRLIQVLSKYIKGLKNETKNY